MSRVNLQKLSDLWYSIQHSWLWRNFLPNCFTLNGEDKSEGIQLINFISIFSEKKNLENSKKITLLQCLSASFSLTFIVLFSHKHCQVMTCLRCTCTLHNNLMPRKVTVVHCDSLWKDTAVALKGQLLPRFNVQRSLSRLCLYLTIQILKSGVLFLC